MAEVTTSGVKGSIVIDHATKRWRDRMAVENISLKLPAGSFTAFIGPSGCGKSTILNMVAGLEQPSDGYVFVSGRQVAGPTTDTALLFQTYNLFPWMTALGNVAFALENRGLPKEDARKSAMTLLERVGLGRFANCTPSELSGGMKQRVALVRAFSTEPSVLLLDEPFGALDIQTRRMMHSYLLATWRDTHATVLMVTHDLSEALALADRVVLMSGTPGRITEIVTIPDAFPRDISSNEFQVLRDRLDNHLSSSASLSEFNA
ncbi:ABC transporter ATP-binding protein [Pandoraea anhela]|uniref:Nitrate ABC transporter ATP-binding protein n=1 Tax=Pandoraea anhela TaxID=2508295 RepID=A0A5E4YS97_9BURK|nr:ABC transporter ATP-binding protein [Pandoraea anhela]VVE51258.1 nitrate ABC transporter ATP-binding protein [Pandoraea anhela]